MTISCCWTAILQRLSDIYICGNIDGNILAVMLWLLYKRILSNMCLNILYKCIFDLVFQYNHPYMIIHIVHYIQIPNQLQYPNQCFSQYFFYIINTALQSICCHQCYYESKCGNFQQKRTPWFYTFCCTCLMKICQTFFGWKIFDIRD